MFTPLKIIGRIDYSKKILLTPGYIWEHFKKENILKESSLNFNGKNQERVKEAAKSVEVKNHQIVWEKSSKLCENNTKSKNFNFFIFTITNTGE